uniref:SMP-30/Gluconolactonase/LRE-like region domain-containing protein n=1 Tax=Pinguiococcus pyrenoidosus TaxID=172671 RepID=A0A7R9U958_9STRA|mmetsp:Transcript_18784/g.71088  ORF Transcript_18784/g.71088 Transcript_18784/m.71088 type:complete len:355 (+) Transcript_18784:123-1187(+)
MPLSASRILRGAVRWASEPSHVWLFVFLPALVSFLEALQRRGESFATLGHVEVLLDNAKLAIPAGEKFAVLDTGHRNASAVASVEYDDAPHVLFTDAGVQRFYKWEKGSGSLTVGRSLFMEKRVAKHLLSNFMKGVLVTTSAETPDLTFLYENGTVRSVSLQSVAEEHSLEPGPIGGIVFGPKKNLFFSFENDGRGRVFRIKKIRLQQMLRAGAEIAVDVVVEVGASLRGLATDGEYLAAASAESLFAVDLDTKKVSRICDAGPFEKPGFTTVAMDKSGLIWAAHGSGVDIAGPIGAEARPSDAEDQEDPPASTSPYVLVGRALTGIPITGVACAQSGYLYLTTATQLLRLKVM